MQRPRTAPNARCSATCISSCAKSSEPYAVNSRGSAKFTSHSTAPATPVARGRCRARLVAQWNDDTRESTVWYSVPRARPEDSDMREDLFKKLAASVIEARAMAKGGKMSLASKRYLEDRRKRWKALRAAGWRIGTVAEFLRLREDEAVIIEIRVALSRALKIRRAAFGMTRVRMARFLDGDVPLISRTEAGDPSITLDLHIRALLLLGAPRKDLASALGGRRAEQKRPS